MSDVDFVVLSPAGGAATVRNPVPVIPRSGKPALSEVEGDLASSSGEAFTFMVSGRHGFHRLLKN